MRTSDDLSASVKLMALSRPENADSAELRELRRRNKLLEQESEILRRAMAYFARDVLPK